MYNIVYWSFIFDLFNREFQRYIENVIHVDPFNVIFKKSLYYRKDSRNGPVIGVQTYGQVKKITLLRVVFPIIGGITCTQIRNLKRKRNLERERERNLRKKGRNKGKRIEERRRQQ